MPLRLVDSFGQHGFFVHRTICALSHQSSTSRLDDVAPCVSRAASRCVHAEAVALVFAFMPHGRSFLRTQALSGCSGYVDWSLVEGGSAIRSASLNSGRVSSSMGRGFSLRGGWIGAPSFLRVTRLKRVLN